MNIDKNVDTIKSSLKTDYQGAVGIILGASFADFVDEIEVEKEIPLSNIEGLNLFGKDKKENKLIFGKIEDKKIILMLGRLHYNYGYQTSDITNIILFLKKLGCEKLVITTSIGAINKKIKVGDIVTFTDQINFTGRNALYGYDQNSFIDMVDPFDRQLMSVLVNTAKKEMAIKVKSGVIIEFAGPNAETVSESHFAQLIGADVVGFNICNEVLACRYYNIPVVGYALVTNYASAFTSNKIKHEDIVYNRKCASNYYLELLSRFINNL